MYLVVNRTSVSGSVYVGGKCVSVRAGCRAEFSEAPRGVSPGLVMSFFENIKGSQPVAAVKPAKEEVSGSVKVDKDGGKK